MEELWCHDSTAQILYYSWASEWIGDAMNPELLYEILHAVLFPRVWSVPKILLQYFTSLCDSKYENIREKYFPDYFWR